MPETKTLDWYFDFISPYAYLQFESLHRLPADVHVNYVPILFAGLLNHWQHKGPAEIPAKRGFTYRHALWLARRNGIPLTAPPAHPFNPLGALRLAIALDTEPKAIQTIFRFIWRDGHRSDDPEQWAELTHRCGLAAANDAIAQQEVKDTLRRNTTQAIEQGLFGVPTFVVDRQIFWGFDTTDMVLDYLADPAALTDQEMRRVENLPVGVQRQ